MGIQNIFILLFLSVVHAQNACRNAYCDNKNGAAIQFPFWIQTQQPQICGFPGFNLSCNGQKETVLSIPNSGDFYVSSIDYESRRVTLNDPENCLHSRLLSLNLTSSPFMAIVYRYFTFFSCPKDKINSSNIVNCLSNTTTDILAVNYLESFVPYNSMCEKIVTLPVPVSSFYDYSFPVDLELTWDVSTCYGCGSPTGSANQRPFLRIIILSIVILAVVIPALIVGISFCICMLRPENPQTSSTPSSSETTNTAGLDKSTIETYRKITIEENRCIEGPNDVTCTICLADYVLKETIMFMPECGHCFHEECIEKWLSMNSKCPICRTMQKTAKLC